MPSFLNPQRKRQLIADQLADYPVVLMSIADEKHALHALNRLKKRHVLLQRASAVHETCDWAYTQFIPLKTYKKDKNGKDYEIKN